MADSRKKIIGFIGEIGAETHAHFFFLYNNLSEIMEAKKPNLIYWIQLLLRETSLNEWVKR